MPKTDLAAPVSGETGDGDSVPWEQSERGADSGGEGGGDWQADARLLKIGGELDDDAHGNHSNTANHGYIGLIKKTNFYWT